ncbi:MAG: hypothetical protein DMF37_11350, partial [Verrucomicrobia bacterium]
FSIKSEDGQTSREGVTPQTIADIPTGRYTIIARRGDWEMRGNVEVQRGDTIKKSFAFVSAITNITSEPSGAEIFVDGKPHGRTPLRRKRSILTRNGKTRPTLFLPMAA